jgi:hypothetical protein
MGSIYAQAGVRIEGFYEVKIKSPSDDCKRQAVKMALAKGMKEYVTTHQPEYVPYFDQFATLPLLAERSDELILSHAVLNQEYKKGVLTTEVVADFNIEYIKTRLDGNSAVNRVQREARSEFTFMFVGRQYCTTQACPSGYQASESHVVESEVKEVFQQSNFLVKPLSQLEQAANGSFSKRLLERRFINTAEVNWSSVMSAALFHGPDWKGNYLVVGTYEVLSGSKNEFLSSLWDVDVKISAQVINVADGSSIYSTTQSVTESGKSLAGAIDMALTNVSRKAADILVNKLTTTNTY